MIKPQDVVVLLKIGLDPEWSLAQLAQSLGLSVSAIHRSLGRGAAAGLYDPDRRIVRAASLREFLVHAVKFIFPVRQTGETRGTPTAWAAPRLAAHFAPSDALPLVWPDPLGEVRGIGLVPIHPSVLHAARTDPTLRDRLALVDALRLGDARLTEVAIRELDRLLIP